MNDTAPGVGGEGGIGERPVGAPPLGRGAGLDVARGEWGPTQTRLMQLARRLLAREVRTPSYDSNELVQEAWVRLIQQRRSLVDRQQIEYTARLLMERLLIDRVRRKRRLKRTAVLGTLRDAVGEIEDSSVDALDGACLDRLACALERLRTLDERQARVVELRFIDGMGAEETASVLGVTRRTVARDWAHARSWLRRELAGIESD